MDPASSRLRRVGSRLACHLFRVVTPPRALAPRLATRPRRAITLSGGARRLRPRSTRGRSLVRSILLLPAASRFLSRLVHGSGRPCQLPLQTQRLLLPRRIRLRGGWFPGSCQSSGRRRPPGSGSVRIGAPYGVPCGSPDVASSRLPPAPRLRHHTSVLRPGGSGLYQRPSTSGLAPARPLRARRFR
jgi:hypothetical protein